ncbi:MAG: TolC family protein [Bdellovibrionales bacterium]|nr:TolC family protein [Bdellovibrionales bacterium]
MNYFYYSIFSILFICNQVFSNDIIKRFDIDDNIKPIGLKSVIQQGLYKNNDVKIREFQDQLYDIQKIDLKDGFWLPQVTLSFSSTIQRLTEFRDVLGAETPTAPSAITQLDLGDYTVFNWGKDYLAYLNGLQTIKRNKQVLKEEQRKLKHKLITKYFKLVTKKEVETIYRNQLKHASFIYRLNREKASAKKVDKQAYYQARSEFLRAQSKYYESVRKLDDTHHELAYLINDPPGTKYVIREKLKYEKIKTNLDEMVSLSLGHSSEIISAHVNNEIAERSYEIARRSNWALPEFTIDFGIQNLSWTPSSFGQTYTTDTPPHIDLVVKLEASWKLLGRDGFINHRIINRATLNKGLTQHNIIRQKHFVESKLHQHYNVVKNLEKQMITLEARSENTRKTYDTILDKYTKDKNLFLDFLHALRDYTDTEVTLAEVMNSHLFNKVELAKYTGVDDFGGNHFEDLAMKFLTLEESIIEEENQKIKKKEGKQ